MQFYMLTEMLLLYPVYMMTRILSRGVIGTARQVDHLRDIVEKKQRSDGFVLRKEVV